ncbi:hypothetical protein KUCAC02_006017 [Chaenocephalus aceratus]|uniref:Uncharacterized protein n=1 Tax=Chaenocephalus aceratus TaxID=36190 RepID=A0ACB9WQK9_CHAAC|nr:hypothetical protein KUCAC02_006017 [Chaenocephalus aceratus]
MAASAKRKQEEKHLKMLREMTSLPPNRKCFDCDQRGPTYANMTVGSFVCTSCSGILRGLNPPHRVKSISMTTFTQQEIEYLQKHGNEVCKQIWLSLYDDRTTSVPDFREPQKVKEFLQEKYEKKRWHVPPEQAKPAAPVHASISGSSNSSTSSTPEVRPLKSLLGESAPSLHLNKNTPPNQSPVVSRGQSQQQQPFHDKRFDLLSELGGDIFAAPPNMNAGASSSFANFAHFNSHTTAQSANANANFANFDAFGSTSGSSGGFPSAPQAQFQPSNTGAGLAAGGGSAGVGGPPQRQPGVPAGCDRYAALAELGHCVRTLSPSHQCLQPHQHLSRPECVWHREWDVRSTSTAGPAGDGSRIWSSVNQSVCSGPGSPSHKPLPEQRQDGPHGGSGCGCSSSIFRHRLHEYARWLWECGSLQPPHQLQWTFPAAVPRPGPLPSAPGVPPATQRRRICSLRPGQARWHSIRTNNVRTDDLQQPLPGCGSVCSVSSRRLFNEPLLIATPPLRSTTGSTTGALAPIAPFVSQVALNTMFVRICIFYRSLSQGI